MDEFEREMRERAARELLDMVAEDIEAIPFLFKQRLMHVHALLGMLVEDVYRTGGECGKTSGA